LTGINTRRTAGSSMAPMQPGMSHLRLADRKQAGQRLAQRLQALRLPPPVTVLALPRGGVPVAAEVARVLAAPLDLLLVRKIGMPWQPELALAAVVEGDPPDLVCDDPERALDHGAHLQAQLPLQLQEMARQRQAYLQVRAPVGVQGRTVVLVDDGIATGTTVRAALRALRRRGPARLVLAVPVAPADTLQALSAEVDAIVCLVSPQRFRAVGEHYVDFSQVEDAQVIAALQSASTAPPG
jgi:putative phosphoribosyl transferase